MPEGPQVKRTGNMIADFVGSQIIEIPIYPQSKRDFTLELPVTIEKVETKGKNIYIYLSNGRVLYNHMLMWGKRALGCESLSGRKHLNTCFKTTKGDLGYYGGGVLKFVSLGEAQKIKAKLGPDMIVARSATEAFALLSLSELTIGEALLSQELLSGVGNIYKSEALFAARLNPFRITNTLTIEEKERLYDFLHHQMVKDITYPGIVTTTPELLEAGYRRYVYRRYHQPCLVCGVKVERVLQGVMQRSTYYCSTCQVVNL